MKPVFRILILFIPYFFIIANPLAAQSENLKPTYSGSRNNKRVALTIDDGWVNDPELLALLDRYDIPCTVFIPGKVAISRPEFVKDLARRGYEIANHTWSHRWLTRLSDKEVREEFRKCQELLYKQTGQWNPYVRPPSGDWDQRIARIAAEERYTLILWDNDAMGYLESQTKEDQLRSLRKHKRNGNIILCHFGSRLRTAEVLSILIPEMISEGYTFVTLTKLLTFEDSVRKSVRASLKKSGISPSMDTPEEWKGPKINKSEQIEKLLRKK